MPRAVDYAALLEELGSTTFTELRPAQEAALKSYADSHSTTPDLAIELPTGAGKSLIALLICEAWRRDGSTVAVLTGNKTLARQMEAEGKALGVPVERFEGVGRSIPLPRRRTYRRAQAIGVMNYWVMFNQNPVIDSADLLVIDDAHLAESALDSLFSVEIDRYAHQTLFDKLVRELAVAFPDYATFQDAVADAPARTGAEMLSFLDQSSFVDRLRSMIDNATELQTDDDLRFRWERVRDRLHEVNLYADTRSLWLRPYVYPLRDNDRYSVPQQRIYMSATIGDPADLARRLGTLPIVKLPVSAEQSVKTYGRRLLVLNPDDPATIPGRLEAVILAALRAQPKSLWLCSSKADAERIRETATSWLSSHGVPNTSWLLTSLGDELDRFKAARAGHLFVAGRFDGMDFNADECRLVVLATQPRAINLQEAFAADYLRDAAFMVQRLNQRILQALGRCNRAEDDYGVYLLADRRFASHFSQETRRRGLPANVLAEVDIAENHTELTTDALVEYVEGFLGGDFTRFDAELADAMRDLPAIAEPEPDDSSDEVAGWLELHSRQNYRAAEKHFHRRQQTYDDRGLRELGAFAQWCEAKAAFLEGRRGDPAAGQRALDSLEAAIDRGGRSSWFNRLRSSLLRHRRTETRDLATDPHDFRVATVQAFDELLERIGPRKLDKWRGQLDTDLQSDSHDQFSAGLATLGTLLGYTASRPKYGAATDCRWRGVFGNWREVITWEAKIEQKPAAVVDAHAMGQAHNQESRAETELGTKGYRVRGTVVTHLQQIEPSAASSAGSLKVVRKDAVLDLWARVSALLGAYAADWSADNSEARLLAADRLAPKLPPTGWLDRALTQEDLFVESATFLSEWPT
jgi:Rad3-related DNA helicase